MQLAPPFHDHAVLQRDRPIPVWGTAAPGVRVTVGCGGRTAVATAGRDGRWLLRLPPLPAGGPHELVATAADGESAARDILVGEVWLCSGQSNMQWPLELTDGGAADAVDLPGLRLLGVANPAMPGRTADLDGAWTVCTRATLTRFSAVAGWFGRELHRELGVPVGLVCNAWGGTRIQAWISREALVQDAQGLAETLRYEAELHADGPARTWSDAAGWERDCTPRDAGDAGSPRGWQLPSCADDAWPSMLLPGHWQDRGHRHSGVFWFRRGVDIPSGWRGRDLELHLGAIDKHDDTWVNGERVGGMSWERADAWCTKRVYRVPARLVGPDGRVVVAVRARSHVYNGGLSGPAADMRLQAEGDASGALPLAGAWRYQVEQDWGLVQMPYGPGNPNSPSILFDSRVAPLIPYALRGAIWYQGESNAAEAMLYRRLMPLLIRDWRRAWGQGDFPFGQVQLAGYKEPAADPGRSDWAELREAQQLACAEPATGLAVAIDLGESGNIHPRRKREVGVRLARWALAEAYQRGGAAQGPVFAGCAPEPGGRLRCRFRHGGGGLVSLGGPPREVAIAGPDRRFVRAEAAIEGDTLVAWSPQVPQPVAVRYAWADHPEGCNLAGAEGLPVPPFRSDDWPA